MNRQATAGPGRLQSCRPDTCLPVPPCLLVACGPSWPDIRTSGSIYRLVEDSSFLWIPSRILQPTDVQGVGSPLKRPCAGLKRSHMVVHVGKHSKTCLSVFVERANFFFGSSPFCPTCPTCPTSTDIPTPEMLLPFQAGLSRHLFGSVKAPHPIIMASIIIQRPQG